MAKTNIFKKIFKDKYKNPWSVKLFIFCLLIIPLAVFAVFVIYGNLGGLLQAFQKEKEGSLIYEDFDLPRSFVLTDTNDGCKVYLSRISSQGLKARAEENKSDLK